MSQLSMENLPELLQMSLTKLIGEQHLIHWNINSNGNTTSISMKFITPGHIVHATPVSQSGSKKSYGQYQRDMNRYMSWNGAGQENATGNIHDDDSFHENITKQTNGAKQLQSSLRASAKSYTPGQNMEHHVSHEVGDQNKPLATNSTDNADHAESTISSETLDTHKSNDTCNNDNNDDISLLDTSGGIYNTFEKVVVDTRGCLSHTTVRGKHSNGLIMLYEINNPDSFQVINKTNSLYEENVSLIDRFRDVRYSTSGWGSFGGRFHEEPWESSYVKQLFDLLAVAPREFPG